MEKIYTVFDFNRFETIWFCLPTPYILANGGGGPTLPLVVHQPASPVHLACSAFAPAGSVYKSSGDNVVHMWLQLKRCCVFQRRNGGDGCELSPTLCNDLRKGYLFMPIDNRCVYNNIYLKSNIRCI